MPLRKTTTQLPPIEVTSAGVGSPVTTADIARHVGLSAATVSHVLTGRADKLRIRPDTQRRVLDAVKELGYRPNASARAIRTGRFGSAALIQPLNNVYMPVGLILGLAEELEKHDMHLSVAKLTDESLSDEAYLPKVVRELTADGLLINMIVGVPASFRAAIREHNIPTIWINNRQEADCIHPDDLAGGRLATEHLLRLGHRRIVFLRLKRSSSDNSEAHYSEKDRLEGYEAAMKAAGLPPRTVLLSSIPVTAEEVNTDKRVHEVIDLLRSSERPTAIVAYELEVALPVLFAAAHAGLKVPRDLSVVMFHDGCDSLSGVPITAVQHNMWSLGIEAVRMLVEKVSAPERSLPARALPSSLFEGGTSGPPSSLF